MILFKEGISKEIKRGALALKKLIIEEDVEVGSDVNIGVDSKNMNLVIYNKSVEEIEEAEASGTEGEVTLLVKEFSPVNGVKTHMEVTVCGEYMLIELISGAVLMSKPDSTEPMLVYRDMPDEEVDKMKIVLDKATWIGTEKIRAVLSKWGEFGASHVQDYSYDLEISADNNGLVSYRRLEVLDISQGMLDVERERRAQHIKEIASRNASRIMAVAETSYSDDEDEYSDSGCGSEEEEEGSEYSDEAYL